MSSVLPFDIIALIIDIVEENNDTGLLKELALVSHSFHQICSKHLFATVELHDDVCQDRISPSMNGFVKLLRSRPNVVKYIRKFTYSFQLLGQSPYYDPSFIDDNHLLLSILPNLLRTISHLNCFKITSQFQVDWNDLDSSLTSAFLYLMHLPTIDHIDLSLILDSHCLVSILLSTCIGSIYYICSICTGLKTKFPPKLSSHRSRCQKFVNSIPRSPSC